MATITDEPLTDRLDALMMRLDQEGRPYDAGLVREAIEALARPKVVGTPCQKCLGCGQVADTDDQEPWSMWMDLPLKSSAAVLIGMVKPIPCPACSEITS